MKSCILLCTIIFICCGLKAQGNGFQASEPGQVRGIVRDANSLEPLPNVHLIILNQGIGDVSSDEGTFHFRNLENGSYSLRASYIGYEDLVLDSILVVENKAIHLELKLKPSSFKTAEVIVTASRHSQTIVSTPVSVDLVKAEKILEQNITTFDQVFEGSAGVQVTRSSGANVQALSIRGASEVAGGGTGNRVMLLIDGRPSLSPESGGALWNLVPVNSIEKVEIVKGAYSALFGSSAMGGVINVITKKPTDKPTTLLNINYGFYSKAPSYTGYNNYSDFNTIELSHSNQIDRIGYSLDLSRKSNDGHRAKSGYELYNLYGKIDVELSQNNHLTFSGNVNKINNDTPATWLSRIKSYDVAEHRLDDYQERSEYNADIHYFGIPNGSMKYSSRLYYYQNFSKYLFDENPQNDSTNVNFKAGQFVDKESIRAQRIGNITQFDFYNQGSHYFLAGLDIAFDKIHGLPDTVLYGSHKAFNFGLYGQDEITLTESLLMTAGARIDYYNIIGEFNEFNFSPKLAFVYSLSDRISVRSLFAKAYRNPSMAERFIKFEQGGGLHFQPNPDLKSEKLQASFEIGSRLSLTRELSVDLAYFYNNYRDLISFQQIPNPDNIFLFQVVNLKKALMKGFEINFSFQKGKYVDFHLGYTYLDAKDISENRINDHLAYKVKHNANFSISTGYRRFGINLNGRYRSKIDEVFIYPGSEPGENFVLNSNLTYHFSENFSSYFTVHNFTNCQYEELERYRMPGRSYSLGARLKLY